MKYTLNPIILEIKKKHLQLMVYAKLTDYLRAHKISI